MKYTIRRIISVLVLPSLIALTPAVAASAPRANADIIVMTQNQYLGADLNPVIGAQTAQEYAQAVVNALQQVIANRLPQRIEAQVESIIDRQPHLVGLQEVFAFGCIPNPEAGANLCPLFQGAFNDHLAETVDALAAAGSDYYVAAIVQNLSLPGLPVYLNADLIPEFYVSVQDRDVILARGDVDAWPSPMYHPTSAPDGVLCQRPSVDGCNFNQFVSVDSLAGPIAIERGFVAVDADIDGNRYRFVDVHLEVQSLGTSPFSQLFQAWQATQLNAAVSLTDAGTRLIIAGDINSSPDDQPFQLPFPAGVDFYRPYDQLVSGRAFDGTAAFQPIADTWLLRPGRPPGHTCCELSDLSNVRSLHDERIDVVLARPAPASVKANVMDTETSDKTELGLWPSDHASVVAELHYD